MASNPKKYGRMGAGGRKRLEKEERRRIEREVRAEMSAKMRVPFPVALEILEKQLEAFRARSKSGEYDRLDGES